MYVSFVFLQGINGTCVPGKFEGLLFKARGGDAVVRLPRTPDNTEKRALGLALLNLVQEGDGQRQQKLPNIIQRQSDHAV